jgi:hypothetical protein
MIHAKHLVIYWYSKGHKADAINDTVKDDFGVTAPPYSTVTYWYRKLKLKDDILVIRRGSGRLPEVDLDHVILEALNEFLFHNLYSPSRVLKRPLSTIRDHLIRGGFVVKHLKRVPHMLTAEHKEQRVQLAKGPLKTIVAARRDLWSHLSTDDEIWLYLSTDYETIWLQDGEERPIGEKKIIRAEKMVLTTFLSPKRIPLIDVLPEGGGPTPAIGCPTSSVAQANLTIKINFNILPSFNSSDILTIYLHAFLQSLHPFEKNYPQSLPRDFRQNNPNTNKKLRWSFSAISISFPLT